MPLRSPGHFFCMHLDYSSLPIVVFSFIAFEQSIDNPIIWFTGKDLLLSLFEGSVRNSFSVNEYVFSPSSRVIWHVPVPDVREPLLSLLLSAIFVQLNCEGTGYEQVYYRFRQSFKTENERIECLLDKIHEYLHVPTNYLCSRISEFNVKIVSYIWQMTTCPTSTPF